MTPFITFKKLEKGNVAISNQQAQSNEKIVAVLNPAQSIIKDRFKMGVFKIQNQNNPNAKAYVFDFKQIDLTHSYPAFTATNFDDFLTELSENFFFLSKATTTTTSANPVIPFGTLLLKAKGVNNCVPNTGTGLEIGDIVTGWKDESIYWEAAQYNGGNSEDKNNYTPIFQANMNTNCTIATPVDAVVSSWSNWGTCDTVTSTQTRTRTLVTPAINGGTTPTLVETQACVPLVISNLYKKYLQLAPLDPNDYYTACSRFHTAEFPLGVYYTEIYDFYGSEQLYSDSQGLIPAPAGVYSDGVNQKLWDGFYFQDTAACPYYEVPKFKKTLVTTALTDTDYSACTLAV